MQPWLNTNRQSKQTDRNTDRQTDRQTGRQKDRQTDRQTEMLLRADGVIFVVVGIVDWVL